MAFISAKCPECGGAIQLDDSKESGFCMYCGTKVLLQESISQKVIIEGIQTLDRKIENAGTFLKLEEFDKAFDLLNQITEEYPGDYRAWWMLAKLKYWTCDFKTQYWWFNTLNLERSEFGLTDIISTSKEYSYAVSLADSDAKQKIKNEYESYLAEIRSNKQASQRKIEATINGDYSFINHCHMVNYGYEIMNDELYFWEDMLKLQTDLRIDKVDVRALDIKSINDGFIKIGDREFIMSAISPDCYIKFCRDQEQHMKENRRKTLGIIAAIVSAIVFLGVFLKWW